MADYIAFPLGEEPVPITGPIPSEYRTGSVWIYNVKERSWSFWKAARPERWQTIVEAQVPRTYRTWVLILE